MGKGNFKLQLILSIAALSVVGFVILFLVINDSANSVVTAAIVAVAFLLVALVIVITIGIRNMQKHAAKQNYEFAQAIIDSAPVIINQWDNNYNLIGASIQAVKQHKVESPEHYIEQFFNLSPEFQPCGTPSREKALRYVKAAFDTGYIRFEWLHQTLYGEPIPSMVTLVRTKDKNKEMVLGYVADLREIRENEEFYKAILDNSPLLIEFWDTNGNLLDGNQKIQDMLKVSSKVEFIGRFYELSAKCQPCGKSPIDKNIEMINLAVEKGSARSEWTFILPDGEELPTETTWVHVVHQGKPLVIVYSQDLRAVKKADAARREAEALNNLLFDSSPFIVDLWDSNLNLISTSSQSAEMLGLKSQEQYIELFDELSPENQPCGTNSAEKAISLVKQAFSGDTVWFEWMHQTLDGTPVPTEVTLKRFERGGEYFVAAYTVDLRPLKEADQKVREAEEMNELILGGAPVSINVLDENFALVICNQQTLELFKVPDKESYLENLRLLTPELQPCGSPSIEKQMGHLKTAMEKGFVRFEWIHQTLDGEIMPTEITMVRFEKNGKPMIVSYTVDLRPIKASMQREGELEKRLLEQELDKRLRLVVDSAPMSVAIFNAERKPIDCNEDAVTTFGFTEKRRFIEALNVRFFDFFPAFQPCGTPSEEKVNYLFDKVMVERGVQRLELAMITGHGEDLPTELTFVCLDHQDTFMFVAYVRDLRDLKKAQEESRRNEIIEESNRAKSAFLARMSHEVRTPISVIMGISGIELQNPAIPPRTEEAFAKIYNSSNLLLSLVNDMLDLSKTESGKMMLVPDRYEVAGMIADAAQLHLAYTQGKDIAFRLSVDADLPAYLIGDVVRIVQILNNLLSNAFKYTESGFVDLTLAGQRGGDNFIMLVITVSDTGYGMTAGQVNNISTEYSRFHEDGKRHIEGVGLGMSIVYNLVQLMGASIEIESEVDVGTKITISIPQEIASSEVLGIETAENLQRFDSDSKTASKKFSFTPEPMPYGSVLVVDDMDDNLYVAKGLLAFYSLTVETCNSGQEAVNKIKAGNMYDLIFLDYMMPGMDGIEALQKIRGLGYTRPVVVLTANAMIGQAEAFINSGFDGFISKPIQTNHLNSILTKHIRDKQPPEVIEAAKTSVDIEPPNIHSFQDSGKLVNKLRMDFVKKYGDVCSDILNAIASEDTKTAHLLAHTLKSVAGLIHELPLMKAAERVEYLLGDSKIPDRQCLSDLENEFKRVIEDIDVFLPEDNGEYLSIHESVNLLDKVAPLLKNRNSDSLSMVDELRKIPGASALCDKIEDFDFKEASEILATLKLSLGAV